ncbi:LemA family protein [Pradoshia sp.]
MKRGTIILISGIAVVGILIAMFASSYNGFVSAEEDVDQSYSQIETQLQRRADLIPNLVNTVKGYASHEEAVINDVTEARANLANANTPADQATANDELTGALNRLLVVVENYPDLKANANYQQLMDELAGTENRIAVARKDYNEEVSGYNKKVKQFPGAMIAGMFNFDEKEYFRSSEGAEQPPTVDFGTE